MSDEKDKEDPPVEKPTDPDPDITAPEIEYVLNTYDPSKKEGEKIINEDKKK